MVRADLERTVKGLGEKTAPCAAAFALAAALLTASAALAEAAALRISQSHLRFSESKVLVAVGQVVTFANDDTVTHNISVRSGSGDDTLDLGLQKPGVPVSHRFDQKGLYSIVCSIHPKMRLIVRVD